MFGFGGRTNFFWRKHGLEHYKFSQACHIFFLLENFHENMYQNVDNKFVQNS